MATHGGVATIVDVFELDALFAGTVQNDFMHVLTQTSPRRFHVELIVFRQRFQHLEVIEVTAIPAANRAASQRKLRVLDHAIGIEILLYAEAVTGRAGSRRVVEREQTRFQLAHTVAANWAGEVGGKEQFFRFRIVHIRDDRGAAGEFQCGFKRFRQALGQIATDFETIDHDLNGVFLLQLQLRRIGEIADLAINTGANEILERGRVNREGGLEKADEYEWSDKFGFDRLSIKKDAKQFIEFKNRAVEALNKNMDSILAVSQRVLDLAVENHIEKEKLILSYIGTRVAEFQIGHSNCEIGDYFKIGYLGSNLEYEEKGYPFLLDALEEMDSSYAAKIELVLTTTTRDKDAYIQKKLKKFHKVKIIHGYSHADLHNILTGVNLGVIPVLWEDNLPQVAIEMVAFGVPILSSSAGGASELTRSDAFRFNVGDTEDFLKKIYAIVDQEVSLDEFWKNHSGLCTNQEHYEQIEKVYALGKVNNISLSGKEVSEILEEKDFLYQHFVEDDVDVYRKKIERLSTELEEVRKQRDNLGWRLSETRKSKTYKIGRAITAIPRKIREVK